MKVKMLNKATQTQTEAQRLTLSATEVNIYISLLGQTLAIFPLEITRQLHIRYVSPNSCNLEQEASKKQSCKTFQKKIGQCSPACQTGKYTRKIYSHDRICTEMIYWTFSLALSQRGRHDLTTIVTPAHFNLESLLIFHILYSFTVKENLFCKTKGLQRGLKG